MTVLSGFPLMSQLADVNEPNKQFDCVPTDIAASLQWLLGKPFDGAAIKDAVYGKSYTGGTDAAKYVEYCSEQGVHLFEISDATPAQLVEQTHSYLAQQKPVILTILDPYVPASYGWTHAIVAHEDTSNEITVLDPYIGKSVTKSDEEWDLLLRTSSIWILERIDNMPPPLTLTNPEAAKHFDQISNTQWKCKTTGKILKDGMLKYYCSCSANPLQGLHDLGLPVSNEVNIQNIDASYQHLASSGITVQFFERGVLVYDVKKLIDNPPGSGSVYPAQIYMLPGQDPLIKDLKTQIATMQGQQDAPQLHAAILQIKEIVATLQ